MAVDFVDTVYLPKSKFIVTDHMTRPVAMIDCLARSCYCGHNVVLTRVLLLPMLYIQLLSQTKEIV